MSAKSLSLGGVGADGPGGCCLSHAEHGTCPRVGVAGAEWNRCSTAEYRQGKSGSGVLDLQDMEGTAGPLALFTDVLLVSVLLAWERSLLALIFMFSHSPC